jgi:hypothetical protein
MGKQHGKATIKVNGEMWKTRPDATLDPGGVTREADTDFPGDYTESARPSEVSCVLPYDGQVSPIDINRITGATIVFESDNGKRFVIPDASSDGQAGIGSEGISATFFGKPAEEMS